MNMHQSFSKGAPKRLAKPETDPPTPVTLTARELLLFAQFIDDFELDQLGELIAEIIHRGNRKFQAHQWFQTTIQELTREAYYNANAKKILKILAKYGITETYLRTY